MKFKKLSNILKSKLPRWVNNISLGVHVCKRYGVKFNILKSFFGMSRGEYIHSDKSITVNIWYDGFEAILFHEIGHHRSSGSWDIGSFSKLHNISDFQMSGKSGSYVGILIGEVEASEFSYRVLKKIGLDQQVDVLIWGLGTYVNRSEYFPYKEYLNLYDVYYEATRVITGKKSFKDFLRGELKISGEIEFS